MNRSLILVVDDDPTARILSRAALAKTGFAVREAENGEEALRLYRILSCDLVMLDVDMPGLDGYQVCAQLRREAGDELPIIMVTGMDDVDSVQRAFDAGATDFMAKPVNRALIGHRVNYLLRARRVLQDLHQANARNTAILRALPDTLLRLGGDGQVLDRHLPGHGHPLAQAIPAHILERIQASATVLRNTGATENLNFEFSVQAGGQHYYETRLGSINDQETLCLVRNITERKQQELDILAARNKLRATLDAIPDLMFELDMEGRYLDYHSPRQELLVAPPEQLLGRTVAEVLPAEAAATCMAALREADARGLSSGKQFALNLAQGTRWFELSVSRKCNGRTPTPCQARLAECEPPSFPLRQRCEQPAADLCHEPLPHRCSSVPGADRMQMPTFIVLSRDITERKEAERQVYRLAYYDTLTGLPNRLSFCERLELEIRLAQVQQSRLAVLFLDLDGFKNVNDTLGHGAGDRLLQRVADRLRQGVRPADLVTRSDHLESEIELARLGGDEFTLLITRLPDHEAAPRVARRINELLRQPITLDGREMILTASIGIAVYPDNGEESATLLKHADTAMYHAKDRGRDNCQFYSAGLTQVAMRRLDLESNLRRAVERGEFFLAYQPQLDLASGCINSVEALLRWNHPELGLIPPMEFIPAAEANGLIVPIGEWVLRTACRDLAHWRANGHSLRVAVNLSAAQFRSPDLVRRIETILSEAGVVPAWLDLEVTEGALMEDSSAILGTLNALRGVGLNLSLDDFGTGYSSLSYLKRLPLASIKIDQSFVRGLPDDRESLAIVRAIVSLAKNLGFTLTAEGIETLDQACLLQQLGCETLQGYFISKPLPAADIPPLLARSWTLAETAETVGVEP